MKLSGSNRNGRHLSKNSKMEPIKIKRNPKRGSKRILRFLTAFFLVIVAIVTAVFAYYKLAVKPPESKNDPRNTIRPPSTTDPNEPDPSASPPQESVSPGGRDKTKYTFLVLASDDGNGNTDTIMAVTFDTDEYTVDAVSIPRDTMVNVSWSLKKVNSIMANMKASYRKEDNGEAKAMNATVEKFADILGFEVDYYVLVDMKAFVKLVDSIGGVDFYVPVNMSYDDPAQNLSIHYKKGMYYGLTGKQALEIVRCRNAYANADIGRINTQQDFLKAVAEQLLAKKNSISIVDLADIFINYVKTDMKLNDIIWFGKELLKLDAENIGFETMPFNYYNDTYVTIDVDEWLTVINEKLNPFYDEIKAEHLSILTKGSNGKLYVTDGNFAGSSSWTGGGSSSGSSGSSSGGSQSNNASQPSESPKTPSAETPQSGSEDDLPPQIALPSEEPAEPSESSPSAEPSSSPSAEPTPTQSTEPSPSASAEPSPTPSAEPSPSPSTPADTEDAPQIPVD